MSIKTYRSIVIADPTEDQILPVNTDAEIAAAEIVLREAGVESAVVWSGHAPDAVETSQRILAAADEGLTREAILAAIANTSIDAYFVTETTDGIIRMPGLDISWDNQDPNNEGWAYSEAQKWDADTMQWDGDESGGIDDMDELAQLLTRAEERAAQL